jgi:hypothetical protein
LDYSYGDCLYEIVKNETVGLEAIYEDYVIHLIGDFGLRFLKQRGLVESCGKVNGRALVTLCKKES